MKKCFNGLVQLFFVVMFAINSFAGGPSINETFMNNTAPGWILGGNAVLTSGGVDPVGSGWLRLTDNTNSQAGSAIYNTAFSSAVGVQVIFKYATYGGSGADGFSFYLIDGSTASPTTGAAGSSLGYSKLISNGLPGVTNGYIGIGFDEYGGFSTSDSGDCSYTACFPAVINSVAIRGSGSLNGAGFNFYTKASALIGTGSRAGAKTVRITITPAPSVNVTVEIDSGAGFVTVINNFNISGIPGQAAIPPTFKMGFGASTGGITNYHEIRGMSVGGAIPTAGVTLDSLGNITGSTVFATGTATGTGISERGFYWWIPPTPENHFGGSESGLIPEGGSGAGSFSLNITGLKPGNTYHIKAYIKAGGQIFTSDEQIFTTATTGATGKTSPTVSTTSCTLNADGTVTAAGQITDIGTSPVNVYGFLYAKHPYPFTGDNGDTALAMWDKAPVYQSLSFTGTIGNLAPGKWYLRAYAHNDNPDSDAAQTASLSYGGDCTFTVPGDVPLPAAPGGLTATAISQTQIDLSWTDNSTDETGFRIFRDGVELTPSPKVGANVTTFSDTGVTCGTTYTYTVKAVNADGDSAGVTATATTFACTVTIPAAPGGLTATAVSQTQINLLWTDNSSNETGFRLFRNGVELTPSPKVGANVTTFSDTGVVCGTTYTYEVKATNASGDSAGVTATATTPACASGSPTAPGGLTATAISQTQINLLWTDNSSNETGFRIFRNGVELTPSPKVGANVTTFSDTGLTCGTTYTYEVKATNASGDSAGVTATATTPACASGTPAAPGGLTATAVSQTQINLLWTDNSSNETGFRIFRNGVELTPSPKVGANVTTFSDTGLTCGTTYTYTVKAVNAAGDSAGVTATATTPACPYVPPPTYYETGSTPAPSNQAPVADILYASTEMNRAVSVLLTGSDPDAGNWFMLLLKPLTYSVVTQPLHGTLTGTVPNLTYTPDQGFTGTDSFTYRVYDGTAYSAPAPVQIIVHQNSHANIGDKYEIDIFCAEYEKVKYGFRLNLTPVAADPSAYYWKADVVTFGKAYSDSNTKGCIPVEKSLQLNVPTAVYRGTVYQFTLNYMPVQSDPFGFYWKMDLGTLKAH